MARPCINDHEPSPYNCAMCFWCQSHTEKGKRYRAAWGEPEPSQFSANRTTTTSLAVRTPQMMLADDTKCKHLGVPNGYTITCPSCRGKVDLKLFTCSIHGQCVPTIKTGQVASCINCNQYVPKNEASKIQWSIGITTVPERKDDLLPQTLHALRWAGFDQPIRLFVDNETDRSSWLQYSRDVTVRDSIRTHGNWILSIYELYLRNPMADRFALFQDDCIMYKNLRAYLDQCPYPIKGYLNLYTNPQNQVICPPKTQGWYRSNQNGQGAVGLVFSYEALMVLLTAEHMAGRPRDSKPSRPAWKCVDGGIVSSFTKAGWIEYVHNPSLIQHVGTKSTMGNASHAQAESFLGVNYDALSLLGTTTVKV